jgi:hypothetical protein
MYSSQRSVGFLARLKPCASSSIFCETARSFYRAGCRTTPSTPDASGPASVWFRLWGIVPVVERHREVIDAEVGSIKRLVEGNVAGRDRLVVLPAA